MLLMQACWACMIMCIYAACIQFFWFPSTKVQILTQSARQLHCHNLANESTSFSSAFHTASEALHGKEEECNHLVAELSAAHDKLRAVQVAWLIRRCSIACASCCIYSCLLCFALYIAVSHAPHSRRVR